MNINDYIDELNESRGTPAEEASLKVLKKVESGTSKEKALAYIVSKMSESKQKAESFLDGVLKILKRDHGWKKIDMLEVSNFIDEFFM